MTRHDGFTLIEVLIAIFITALIGLGSWQILNDSIRINERTSERLEELAELQRFMLFVSRDMQQLVHRSIRDEYGDLEPALNSRNDFYKLAFSKLGWRNPLQDPRSEVQRVAYELDQENTVVRHYWLVLDRSQDSSPRTQKLLTNVEDLEFSFLNESGSWESEWPPEAEDELADPMQKYSVLPRAVRVEIDHSKFGKFDRLFDLVSYQAHLDVPDSESGVTDEDDDSGSENGTGQNGGGTTGNNQSQTGQVQ